MTRSFVLIQTEEDIDSNKIDKTLLINFFFDNKNQKINSNMTDKDKSTVSCLTDKKEKSDYNRADKDKYLSYSYNSIEKQNNFF